MMILPKLLAGGQKEKTSENERRRERKQHSVEEKVSIGCGKRQCQRGQSEQIDKPGSLE